MGDEQTLGYEELLAASREGFEKGTDFTVAVEEEFALLDPATLNLVNRFEEVQAASKGTPIEPHLVGELIASEVEVKTGRCQTFADIPAAMTERRAQLQAVVDPLGIALGATGTHPWSPWQEQRIIDTPHYRRNDELLRYVVWRNNSFGLHVHVGIRGADRAIAVTNGLRNLLPEILALSASSPFHENVNTGLHSARTQIFTRFFPRCGVPDAFASWQQYEDYVRFLYETGSVTEHTQLWWSVRPHLAFPTVEIRIADGQPDLGEAQALAAFATALAARIARAHDEGEPLADQPHRLIEENMWRAIRWGLSGDFLDLERGDVVPTRARLERLLEWIGPVADEIGADPVPRAAGEERRRAADRPLRGRRVARGDLRRAGCQDPGPWLTSRTNQRGGAPRGAPAAQGLRPARADAVDRLVARVSPAVRGAPRSRAGAARDRRAAGAGSRARRLGSRRPPPRLRAGDDEPPAGLRDGRRTRLLNGHDRRL